MRAAISRVVSAPPETVADRLTPEAVVEAEGDFRVKSVETELGRTVVTVWPNGRILAPEFVFEERPDGFAYRRYGEGQGIVTAETTVTLRPAGDGTRVEIASEVETPLPLVGRVAARRRQRAVERIAGRLDAIVG
ncbi:SRPBCC family protein [Halosimplex salinum]|uniref:SRPBCC family protein n=1 Tax=Halosimplex salinum TaxID=1710538 RepID=UPI000F4A1280|nr:SRPBCC family protein [Halosimplex salinum]